LFVGVSPAEDMDFDGDPSWDVGFLDFGRGVVQFYGDECSFTVLPQEIKMKLLDGRSNLVKLEWSSFGNRDNTLNLSVLHSPQERIGKARRDLHHTLKTFSHQPPTLDYDPTRPLPPQFVNNKVVTQLRDPESQASDEQGVEGYLRIWTREQLPYLIWNCDCGEVNIRSHKLCKSCKRKQTPVPKPAMPQFEIEMLPSTDLAERSRRG
jgi:hypothetical protein